MIWTLKVTLCGGIYSTGKCVRVIEIDSAATLEDLHLAIQDAVDFDNDHLYEFYYARTERSHDRVRFDDGNGELFSRTVASMFPPPKDRKLFYLFDYGDSWRFRVEKARTAPHEPLVGVKYPRLVESTGDNPEQYPDADD
jgi:hypothetical protein